MAEKDKEGSSEPGEDSDSRAMTSLAAWPSPRTVFVPRNDSSGYGFTLRHFIVYPPESAAITDSEEDDDLEQLVDGTKRKRSKLGALEPMDTIFVKQVKEGGPAHKAGLQQGDRIVSVNGESVTGKTYSQVIALIQESGASLKLLVVPKDEDVLQMAYHSSAYNHGKHPYKGSATDIPSPPGICTSEAAQGKPPVAPRFKTELQLSAGSVSGVNVSTSSEDASWGSDARVPCCRVTGTSSTTTPRDAFRHTGNIPYLPADGATMHDMSVTSAPPLVPVRTCSKNITLANLQASSHPRDGSTSSDNSVKSSHAVICPRSRADTRSISHENLPRHYGSQERLLRTSNENICVGSRTVSRGSSHLSHSSDDLLSRVSPGMTATALAAQHKARTIGPVNCSQSNLTNRIAIPYTRSQTILSLAPTATGAGAVEARDSYNHNHQGALWCHSNYYYTPRATAAAESSRTQYTSNGGYYSCHDTGRMCWSGTSVPTTTYGLTVSYSGDNSRNVTELPKSYSTDFEAGHSQHEGDNNRHTSTNDRNQPINLVTERMKKFESMDSVDSNSSVGSAASGSGRYQSDAAKVPSRRFGCDSVASRAAQYEHLMSDDDEYMHQEQSPVARQHASGSFSQMQQKPSDINRMGNAAPATINIYFRSESPQHPIMQLDRSPHRPRAASHSPLGPNRRSPRLQLTIHRPSSESTHRHAMRQPSYLSAIHSPKVLKQPEAPMISSGVTMTTNTPSIAGGSVVLRSQTAEDDKETKLSRRTSYLMATRQTVSMSSAPENKLASSNMTQPVSLNMTQPVSLNMTQPVPSQPPPAVSTSTPSPMTSPPPLTTCSKLELQLCTSTLAAMAVVTTATTADEDNSKVVTTTSSPVPPIPRPPTPQSPTQMEPAETTPTKTSNIRKLKAFFGEKTPRIEAATADQKSLLINEVTMEGVLNCKVAVVEGKRASDRSWKPVWALLKNYQLILYKEVTISGGASTTYEEQPICVRQCLVDIATEYAKKKRNVFRLTTLGGCEYLFQTEDHDCMLQWIRAIQQNTGGADNMVAAAAQKMAAAAVAGVTGVSQPQSDQATKSSPGISQKSKKLSSRSLKVKSIGAVSPAFRPKKTWLEKDHSSDSTKTKDNKTWKGRVAKKFKRYGSSSAASSVDTGSSTEVTGTFNVPLEQCPPSNFFEFVPLVVELCIDIVEAKGLENQGIYRVPGNTGSVNFLQELLNNATGVEDLDMDNEKWSDVNVVSSLLKTFFRKLPDPLITEDHYDMIIAANRIENPEKRMLKVKKVLHELPDHNFETFRFLAQHLSRVASKGDVNKMDARNLAIVFGPTLVRTKDDSMVTMVRDMSDQCKVIETIILHHDWFFSSWDEDVYVPVDEESENALPVSGMNRELLSKAEDMEWAERGRDISAKDLMSSIFQAANRRIRRKDKSKSNDSIEIDPDSESSYNERNIDHEIELQRLRDIQQSTTTGMLTRESSSGKFDSLSSSQSMSPSASLQDTKEVVPPAGDSKKPVAPPTYEEHQQMQKQRANCDTTKPVTASLPLTSVAMSPGSNLQSPRYAVTRYPAYPATEFTPCTSVDDIKPTVLRRYSADELGNFDVQKVRQVAGKDQQQSVNTDTDGCSVRPTEAAILQQRECAKERALQRTKEILEQDDNLDDLLSHPVTTGTTYRDYPMKNTDTLSVTSDYSTMSSSNATCEHKVPCKTSAQYRGNLSEYSLSLSAPTTAARDSMPLQSQSCSNLHPTDDRYMKHSPHDGVASYPKLVSSKPGETRPVFELMPSDDGVTRRHGSLDSLIDSYDRMDNVSKCITSGADGTEDFLESITATLDHKLELIAPKSPQPTESTTQNCVDNVVYDFDRPFRNPSLHRTVQSGPEGAHNQWDQGDMSVASFKRPPRDSGGFSACEYSDAIRKSTEQLYGSRDNLIEHRSSDTITLETQLKRKAHSPSPPAARRRRDAADLRRIKRRHTVGGSNDLEHFKALMHVCQATGTVEPQKPSAWERLQPYHSPEGGPPDLKTWLAQQHQIRHVGSSPALFDGALQLSEHGLSPHGEASRLSSKGWRHRTGFSRSASTGEELPSSSSLSPAGGCAGSFTFESEV